MVLWDDEGRNYDARQRDALDHLHKKGLGGGLRAVFLLAGLSPTRSVLAGLGISRQAFVDPDRRDLGRLSDAECAESTRMMLRALRTNPSPHEDNVVSAVTALSMGWPSHLFIAQKELTRELCALDGNLSQVNMDHVRKASDDARIAYYEDRAAEPPLNLDQDMLCRFLYDVEDASTNALGKVWKVVQRHLEDAGYAEDMTRKEYAAALFVKGRTQPSSI